LRTGRRGREQREGDRMDVRFCTKRYTWGLRRWDFLFELESFVVARVNKARVMKPENMTRKEKSRLDERR
jgi:hypothetical protein